jgi:hypothetical protein
MPTQKTPWWDLEKDSARLKEVKARYQDFAGAAKTRISMQQAWDRLYTNRDLTGNNYLSTFLANLLPTGRRYTRLPINVCKVMIDAVYARVVRQGISIKFLTDTHAWSQEAGARQMERYVDFQEHQQGGEAIAKKAYLDALIGGTGAVITEDKFSEFDMQFARVKASDLVFDPEEETRLDNEKATQLFRRQWVSRHQLAAIFPEHAKRIEKAGRISPDSENIPHIEGTVERNSTVEIIHAWKLPSFEGAGDGRYIMFIDEAILRDEEWELADFPIAFARNESDSSKNFWGVGLCEQLMGIHYDINNSFLSVYKTMEMVPRPVLFTTTGAKLRRGMIGNADGLIIESVDGSPRLELPMSVPKDIAEVINLQWFKAQEIAKLASQSLPEAAGGGLTSGQAMRDFNDIQSTELASNFWNYQQFRVRLAEQIVSSGVRVNARAKSEGTTYKVVMAKDRFTTEEIDWDNIALDPRKDSYVIQALPVSNLSQTFAGKKADVLDLMNAGLLDREQALFLLDFPDTSEFFSAISASRRLLKQQVEQILRTGQPMPFDPNDNLRLGLKIYQEEITRAVLRGVPTERVQLLRNNVDIILDLIEKEQLATQQAAQGFQPGLPGSPPAMDVNGGTPLANAEGMMTNAN